MVLNHTSELKVIAVCICYEHPFSVTSVSIYYGTQFDILVKNYCRLNLIGTSVFNLEHLNILRAQSDIRVKSYCHLNFLRASVFHFEHLDILRDTIGHLSKKLLWFDFATSFRFQLRASRYITGHNRTSE